MAHAKVSRRWTWTSSVGSPAWVERAAHESGNAHEWDSEEAVEAGRKGGEAVHHHRNAAFYHESAAHHHRQAAHHHESGDYEEGERHGRVAHGHSTKAHGHSTRSRQGFAGMDPEEQREIGGKGVRASHSGRGHQEEENGSRGEGGGSYRSGGNGSGRQPQFSRPIRVLG